MLTGDYAGLNKRKLRGQADLIFVRNKFYLCLVVEQTEEPLFTPEGYLGVNLGVVKLASSSDGVAYSGEDVEAMREHYTEKKAELQRVGSKSSKRKLRRASGREARFKRYTSHVISKELVAAAARSVVIERDEDEFYIASTPELPGCHTQAKSIDEVMKRIK